MSTAAGSLGDRVIDAIHCVIACVCGALVAHFAFQQVLGLMTSDGKDRASHKNGHENKIVSLRMR